MCFPLLSGLGKQWSKKRCLHRCAHHKNRWVWWCCFFIFTCILNLLSFPSSADCDCGYVCTCVYVAVQAEWELARRRICAVCSTGGRLAALSSASLISLLLTPRMTTCWRFMRKSPSTVCLSPMICFCLFHFWMLCIPKMFAFWDRRLQSVNYILWNRYTNFILIKYLPKNPHKKQTGPKRFLPHCMLKYNSCCVGQQMCTIETQQVTGSIYSTSCLTYIIDPEYQCNSSIKICTTQYNVMMFIQMDSGIRWNKSSVFWCK